MKSNAIRWIWVVLAVLLSGWAHAGTVTYVYSDPQGTPLAEADASGNITARFEYTPYGVSVPSMGAAPNGVGYTGHVNDPETGLVYMQARYYDPAVGRFLSVDPVGPKPGDGFNFNRYDYANNNPIVNIDPDGRKVELDKNSTPQYKKDFVQAIKYMNKSHASSTFAALQKLPTIVHVKQSIAPNDDHYDPSTKTISWDSKSALITTAGGKQTPALGLLHEGGHALGDLTGTGASTTNIPGDPYDNPEEKRVIQNIETPAAKKLGEGVRTDHRAKGGPKGLYQVKCSTCN